MSMAWIKIESDNYVTFPGLGLSASQGLADKAAKNLDDRIQIQESLP
jgi:hypothetical protein